MSSLSIVVLTTLVMGVLNCLIWYKQFSKLTLADVILMFLLSPFFFLLLSLIFIDSTLESIVLFKKR